MHFLALERIFDETRPDVVVPEVGSEVIRTATHLIALERGIADLLPAVHAVPAPAQARGRQSQRADRRRTGPARALARRAGGGRALPDGVPRPRHADPSVPTRRADARPASQPRAVHARSARRRPRQRVHAPAPLESSTTFVRGAASSARARLYAPVRAGPPVRLLPAARRRRLQDQATPPASRRPGVDRRAGRRRAAARLRPRSEGASDVDRAHAAVAAAPAAQVPNIRIVPPLTSSHELIAQAEAIAVISSTVGLEALLYEKPVLTLGAPFYSGYGVTLDVSTTAEIPRARARAAALRARPRAASIAFSTPRCARAGPGRRSWSTARDENALVLAQSLAERRRSSRRPSRRASRFDDRDALLGHRRHAPDDGAGGHHRVRACCVRGVRARRRPRRASDRRADRLRGRGARRRDRPGRRRTTAARPRGVRAAPARSACR